MLVTSFCWLADNFKYLLSLLTLMLPSQLAVVGWFPAANVLADRHTAATNVNPKRFIIPTFLIVIPKN